MLVNILSILLLFFSLLFFTDCKKENINIIDGKNIENSEIHKVNESINHGLENIQSLKIYRGMKGMLAPDGKMLYVYIGKTLETQWGQIYAPVIYLYNEDKHVLSTYDILKLVDERFWGGDIEITYNNKRNSFDMVFSLDTYGNYGTAYIDLITNEFVRELLMIPIDMQREQEREQQGTVDGYIEGANLRPLGMPPSDAIGMDGLEKVIFK